ncbi:MAG: phosphoribosylanthranilate isomerase [Candidatus Omnitrophica bacterium]|nr:phosphoribosylanthranilate isomerase [Candidatus Omnitrophota bacterium]
MVKVKICGITKWEDALVATILGADALGFVFYKKSPRYITPEKARDIIRLIPREVKKIGVFVNAKERKIKQIAKTCCLDMLQFHGDESPAFCKRFKNYKIIKAFRIKDRLDLQDILKYRVFAYLFDTFTPSKVGGTGKKFNWKLLKSIGKIKKPIFLSGGLNKGNIRQAIKTIKSDWVDVSSAVETRPGDKDKKKITDFLETVKKR